MFTVWDIGATSVEALSQQHRRTDFMLDTVDRDCTGKTVRRYVVRSLPRAPG